MKPNRNGIFTTIAKLMRLWRKQQKVSRGSLTIPKEELSGNLAIDVEAIQILFGHADDVIVRHIPQPPGRPDAAVVYIDGLVSKDAIAKQIIERLLEPGNPHDAHAILSHVSAPDVSAVHTLKQVADALTLGKCVLLQDTRREAMCFGMAEWNQRNVEEPANEPTVRGPREGFTEDLRTNIVLLRRRLRTPALRSERFVIGRQSQTQVQLLYLDGIARDEVVAEMRDRIQKIDIDAILDSNYIDELVSDNPRSPFPSLQRTERPDRVVADLLEGRVAVIVDGSPIVLSGPTTLLGLLQTSEDYYLRYHAASFAREIRWIAGLIGLIAPSVYVAILSYHHELIPTQLLFTIAAGREGVPFPPFVEALLMETAFEILREAGLRMPQQIGPALSIVGVLVIGDAAVRAGLVSPLMIVVVGMTAIATFALPSNDLANAIRLLRFPTMVAAAILGLFGVIFATMLVAALLISSRSLGVPMLSPYIPVWRRGLKDAMVRAPIWALRDRPWHAVNPDQIKRQPEGQEPKEENKR